MLTRTGRVLLVILAGALGMGTTFTASAVDSPEDIRAEMQRLQAKLEQIEARQSQNNATIQKMIEDAGRRSQLMSASGMTAGYDEKQGGFFLADDKGDFKLNPYFQFQLRHVSNYREDGGGAGDDDVQNGFELRRMKFGFKGVVFKDFEFNFLWATNRGSSGTAGSTGFSSAGSPILEDAYVQYKFAPDFKIRAGQFKSAVVHEETISSSKQMAVDRSLLNELLGGGITDRVQGVSLLWAPSSPIRGELSFHDGINSDNTNFTESGGSTAMGVSPTNWGVGARVEWRATGESFKQYEDFTALGNKEDMLVFGLGADWSQGGDRNILHHSLDVQYENTRGLGLYAALVGAWRQFGDLAGDDSFYDYGAVVQASYLFSPRIEAFARYDITFLDDAAPTFGGGEDTIQEITAGANYYMHGHRAKFTVDLTYLPDGAPSESGIGFLANDQSEWVLRAQFQLLL